MRIVCLENSQVKQLKSSKSSLFKESCIAMAQGPCYNHAAVMLAVVRDRQLSKCAVKVGVPHFFVFYKAVIQLNRLLRIITQEAV
jgi:hypothetical protein